MLKAPDLENMKPIVQTAISLAQEYRNIYNQISSDLGLYKEKILSLADPRIEQAYRMVIATEEYKKLVNFLNSLTHEEVIALVTIVYLGRDAIANKEADMISVYYREFEYFSSESKYAAIEIMLNKKQLATYLQSGYDVLY